MSKLKELTEEFQREVASMVAREIELALAESKIKEREARLVDLEAREVAVAKRERATASLSNELSLARTRLKTAQDDAAKAEAKRADLKKKYDASQDELGRARMKIRELLYTPDVAETTAAAGA